MCGQSKLRCAVSSTHGILKTVRKKRMYKKSLIASYSLYDKMIKMYFTWVFPLTLPLSFSYLKKKIFKITQVTGIYFYWLAVVCVLGRRAAWVITWRTVKSSGDSHTHSSLRSTRLPTGKGQLEMSAFGSSVQRKRYINNKMKLQDIY